MGYRREVYKDGKLIHVEDTRILEEEQQKRIVDVKEKAAELLAKTDWHIIRAHERNECPDTEVVAKRQAIRDASNEAETKILGFTDLIQLDQYNWLMELPHNI